MTDDRESAARNRAVAIWLLVCCALVFAMVVLGGVTRLTGSGLSIAEWRPIIGVVPPLSDADWAQKFELYQQTPEYHNVNAHMDVDGFKGIFWLEYLHRMLGRTIGLAFLVPFLIFAARGDIARSDRPKYLAMFVLGGLQGALGWYMVKSGLVDVPHVSQYRLTAHLVAAFLVYACMFWVAMSLLFPHSADGRHPWFARSLALMGLISVTIISGGFVAGLKAGKIYNTFPMMGDNWLPPGLWVLHPAWRNLFSNATTVQFDHRVLAMSTFLLIVVFWIRARNVDLPDRARRATTAMLHIAVLQVVLGVSTLLLSVPVALAASHQAVAMLLFTAALFVVHSLRGRVA